MCGITGGAWSADGKPLSAQELARMVAALAHRGPDDAGRYPVDQTNQSGTAGPGAALGHRRLSIIDLGGGHQPMSDASGRVWIAFNGEIYNYRELRDRLIAAGHRFQSESDTEVLIVAYQAWGTDCLTHLRGMFAFAIWDGTRLFLARDRLGQKPLVYREERGRLLFASELKSLLQVDDAPRTLDPAAIDDYLTYQYVPHPRCIFNGYQKLPPAHAAVYERGRLNVFRYWVPPYDGEPTPSGPQAVGSDAAHWRSELRRTLTEAVRLRLRSDVPLGAFLSGGVDSTIIAGLMQEVLREAGGRPAQTFSIGFPVVAFDERAFAREAATHLGTDHHERVVDPQALDILPKLVWHYDEPFADSSAIPTMCLSEFTRRSVSVSLSGDGGDELFCGYERYKAVALADRFDRLPGPLRAIFSTNLWQRLPASVRQRSLRRRIKRFAAALAASPQRRYLQWIRTFDAAARDALYTAEFNASLAGHDSFSFLEHVYQACPDRDIVTRTTCADVLSYLPCDILTKVDIASMAYGLEARSPFLDHHVAELAATMPLELKLTRRGGKRILIETFSDLLPPSIQTRKKMGFGVPLDHWFRGELKPLLQEVLLDANTHARGLFRPEAVETLVREHTSGQSDHSSRLWSLLVLELWQRTWVDPPIAPIAPPPINGLG